MFFGKKENNDSKKMNEPKKTGDVNESDIAERVYLVPEEDIKFNSEFVEWVKGKLMGERVVMGKKVKVNVGEQTLYFKVYLVEPYSSGIVGPKTRVIISKATISSPSIIVSIDKILGILALLETTLRKPAGYVVMRNLIDKFGSDLSGIKEDDINRVIKDIEIIEEYCINIAKEHYADASGWLAILVLEELYNLRKLLMDKK